MSPKPWMPLNGASNFLPIVLSLMFCGFLLSAIAIVNGYPLVYSDTFAHIKHFSEFRFNIDRPPYYGLFFLVTFGNISLWPAIVVQAIISSIVIFLSVRIACDCLISPLYLVGVVALLTLLTSLPWLTGQLLPDFATGLLILAVYVVTYGWDDLSPAARICVALVLLGAVSFHYSHLLLLAVVAPVALLFAASMGRPIRQLIRPAVVIFAIGATAAASFFAYNYALRGRVVLNADSSRFLLARMIGDGTALTYLRWVCPDKGFVLCAHLDEIKADESHFLWDKATAWNHVYRERGVHGAYQEASEIVRGTLVSFPVQQLTKSLANFGAQLVRFGTGDLGGVPWCRMDYGKIMEKHLPRDYLACVSSRQSQNTLPIAFVRIVHTIAVVIGFLGCLVFAANSALRRAGWSPDRYRLIGLVFVSLTGIVMNAAITGMLSGVYDRYQSRVVWLVVLSFILIVLPPAGAKRGKSAAGMGRLTSLLRST